MRLILHFILLMRIGRMGIITASLNVTEGLKSTMFTSVDERVQSTASISSDTEIISVSLLLPHFRTDINYTTAGTVTSSSSLVPSVTPVLMTVSIGVVSNQPISHSTVRGMISTTPTLKGNETILPSIATTDNTVISSMTDLHETETSLDGTSNSETMTKTLVDEASTSTPVLNTSMLVFVASPTSTIVVSETVLSSAMDFEIQGRKPVSSPLVKANRCCPEQHYLENNNCIATQNSLIFNSSQFKMESEGTKYMFSWETLFLNCSEGFKLQEIKSNENEVILGANTTTSFFQWAESYLTKSTTEYCIGQQVNSDYITLICVPDIEKECADTICVSKCCADGEVFSNAVCKADSKIFSPIFYDIQKDKIPAPDNFKLIPVVPDCTLSLMFSKNGTSYSLLSTGKLYQHSSKRLLKITQYCIEYYPEAGDEIAIYCVDMPSPIHEWKIFLIPIFMMISIIFLLIIIMSHLVTPALRNVQGLCFLVYCLSLLMAYVGFYTNFVFTKQMEPAHCVFNGIFSQFSLLSAFFWLSVMCFDIWRVIRATVKCIPLTGILEKDSQKFMLYSVYAFGCPLVIAMVTLIMQYLPSQSTNDLVVPGFGKESCWFSDTQSQFIYFYSFIAVLNGISLAMLGHILFMLFEAEQGFACFFAKQSSGTSHAFNRKHLQLFRQRLGLFSVMAICWFTEVLSLKIPPQDMWIVTDLLNTLQGVIVFIIFVSSKKKREQVKSSLAKKFLNLSNVVTRTNSDSEASVKSDGTQNSSLNEFKNETEMVNISSTSQTQTNESSRVRLDSGDDQLEKERKEEGGVVNNAFQHDDDDESIR